MEWQRMIRTILTSGAFLLLLIYAVSRDSGSHMRGRSDITLSYTPTQNTHVHLRHEGYPDEQLHDRFLQTTDSYKIQLVLELLDVSDKVAADLQTMDGNRATVYHFCRAVNSQAGGSQATEAANASGALLFTQEYPFPGTGCSILGTFLKSGAIEVLVETEVFVTTYNATANATSLAYSTVYDFVYNGFGRGFGGRLTFMKILMISQRKAFASLDDINVLPRLTQTQSPTARPSLVSLHPSSSRPPSSHFSNQPSNRPSDQISPSPTRITSTSPSVSSAPSSVPTNAAIVIPGATLPSNSTEGKSSLEPLVIVAITFGCIAVVVAILFVCNLYRQYSRFKRRLKEMNDNWARR
eukprot:scaffold421333_cov96-Attheya_sp.AAC.1